LGRNSIGGISVEHGFVGTFILLRRTS
jgi:hypothetical protein